MNVGVTRVRAAVKKIELRISLAAALAALTASALVGCASQEMRLERLSSGQWAIAKGLEPITIDGKQYFCLPQLAGSKSQPPPGSCVTLNQLRRVRFGKPARSLFHVPYEIGPTAYGPSAGSWNRMVQPP
jgi:hypothetical protein